MVFVVPPVSDAMRARKGDAFAKYTAEILRDRAPEDLVLDFTTEELGAIGHDADNFTDGVHLRAAAAARLVGHHRRAPAGLARQANAHERTP